MWVALVRGRLAARHAISSSFMWVEEKEEEGGL
jgi:hypothetical protein